jgi:isochorismate hydrolase
MDISLEEDMKASPEIIAYCADEGIAADFYRALCNMRWRKVNLRPDDEKIIDRLKGEEPDVWSCSWRYAGGIIADIRNDHHGKSEDYMDFYCAGEEGTVTPLVKECFEKLGWEQYPWPDNSI